MIVVILTFRQYATGKTLAIHKELQVLPTPGMYFEYEREWALAKLDEKLNVWVTSTGVGIDGYGPQFNPEETEKLKSLGWTEQ